MRTFLCLALSLTLPGSLRAESLSGDDDPRVKLTTNLRGTLELATGLSLSLSQRTPDGIVQELFQRFPNELRLPNGLVAHTRTHQFGPITVISQSYFHDDLLIDGLSLTVHLDSDGRVRVIAAKGMGVTLDKIKAPLSEKEAYRAADRALALRVVTGNVASTNIQVTPGLVVKMGRIVRVWKVGVDPEAPAKPFELQLDYASGTLLQLVPRTVSERPEQSMDAEASASIYLDDALDSSTGNVTLQNLDSSTGYMTGDFVKVYQYEYPTSIQTADATSQGEISHYDYPPTEVYSSGGPTQETQTDPFAQVMMYYHVDRVHQYFNDLGYFNDNASVGIDRQMPAYVNYRSSDGYYNNAFYSGPATSFQVGTIYFGQGEATDFTYDSSVIYHEYGHAVVDGTSDYLFYCTEDIHGTDCTQGGLNEGTADYFASSLRGDPEVGAYSIGEWLTGYSRDLRDSNRCPDDLYGEEHEDGKVWGGALWDIRTAVAGTDSTKAHTVVDPILLAAIATPIPDDATSGSAFTYAAEILLSDASAALSAGTISSAEYAVIEDVLNQRGLLDCKRFVPLVSDEPKFGAFSTTARIISGEGSAAGLQYVVEVPEGTTSLRFKIEDLSEATVYVRKDAPVEFDLDGDDVEADYSTTDLSFKLNDESTLKLEPSHSYYITFRSAQTLESVLYGYYYTVEAELRSTTDEEDGGGCHCGNGQTPDYSLFPLLTLGGAMGRRLLRLRLARLRFNRRRTTSRSGE